MRFKKLLVEAFHGVRILPSGQKQDLWKCKCDCGKIRIVSAIHLRTGHTVSCGCARIRHGKSKTTIHRTWIGMTSRCENQNNSAYQWYGARGIKVCERWKVFESFLEDMGSAWQPGLTIERKNVNGDYCKDNCVWANREVQANNTTRSLFIEFAGERMTVAQLAKRVGMSRHRLTKRLENGWSIDSAIATPKQRLPTMLTFNGETLTTGEWEKRFGLRRKIVAERLSYGWTPEKALGIKTVQAEQR